MGRTGSAERSGTAFTLATSENKQMVPAINRTIDNLIKQCTLEGFNNYWIPALQQPTVKMPGAAPVQLPGHHIQVMVRAPWLL
jgi:superfamily II DNA/RNA helicase